MGTHFIKGLWDYDVRLVKILFDIIRIVTIKPGHIFRCATTPVMSFLVQNSDLISLSFFKLHV